MKFLWLDWNFIGIVLTWLSSSFGISFCLQPFSPRPTFELLQMIRRSLGDGKVQKEAVISHFAHQEILLQYVAMEEQERWVQAQVQVDFSFSLTMFRNRDSCLITFFLAEMRRCQKRCRSTEY